MPRTARAKTDTRIYHIMTRGINRQHIFEDTSEKRKYLALLRQFRDELDTEIFAYCIMNNHAHLLVRENSDPLESFFRKLNTAYAVYYNTKHERCGHLFQDRYKSEAVKDSRQLLQTIRYIHMNPVKAGICKDPEAYNYSSYSEYTFTDSHAICNLNFVMEQFGSLETFMDFHRQRSAFSCMDMNNTNSRMTDKDALAVVRESYPGNNTSCFQCLDLPERNEVIISLIEKNLSIRQISRSTGISIDIVRRVSAKYRSTLRESSASEEPSP